MTKEEILQRAQNAGAKGYDEREKQINLSADRLGLMVGIVLGLTAGSRCVWGCSIHPSMCRI